ncbi:MAG: DNA (cytosine-5-)-methyltransferase [Alistipes sp.]|nr:DNA (cytosine-5-)-methyltransferase [Alistipes sp.]
MTHASLFSGIGGFDLAAEWAGWTNVFNCEIDPFCRQVLAYHFPDAIQYEDIKTTDFRPLRGQVDVLTGGFPCQPFSLAGKRRGTDDNRYLWPEMLRAIRELAPRWVVGENVFGIVNWSEGLVFEQVCADLENEGYEVQPFLIPACAVDAPHRRDRVWFVAHRAEFAKDALGNGLQRKPRTSQTNPDERKQRLFGAGDSKWVGGETRPFASDGSNAWFEVLQREGAIGIRESSAFANPNHKRQHELYDSSVAGQKGQSFGIDSSGNVTNSLRQRGSERAEEVQSKFPKRDGADGSNGQQYVARGIPCWRAFPTQSPVCGRNDGLSARLDACAIPEWVRGGKRFRFSGYWRRESIKAYGNAVVPQVVLKIFETINDYEKN